MCCRAPIPFGGIFLAFLKLRMVRGGEVVSRTFAEFKLASLLWAPSPTSAPPLTCATFLQTEALQDLLKLGVLAEMGQLDVDTATQAGAQVGGAGQDVAQVLVPAEGVAGLLEDLLNLTGRGTRDWQGLVAKQAMPRLLFVPHPPPKGRFSL